LIGSGFGYFLVVKLVGVESNAVDDKFGLGDGRWTIPTVNFDFVFFAEGFHISFKLLVELKERLLKSMHFLPFFDLPFACSEHNF